MVPVQRERVVPPVPAEKTEGGAMDRPLLHRRWRSARPTAGDPSHESPTGCRTTACGRRWPNGWAAAGRRCSSAAGCASCGRTMRSCACARRPSTDGSTSRPLRETPGAVPAARAQAAPQARRQEDVALPIPGRAPISERPPEADGSRRVRPLGGRQRHRSGMQPAHRGWRGGPGP